MEHASLFIIIDGFRYDYIKKMPFLASIGKRIKIEPIPSFCLRPTIFSGNGPNKTKCFVDFTYSKKSPFKILSLFNFKPKLKQRPMHIRWLLSMIPYLFCRRRIEPFNIPLSMLQFFDISSEYINYSDQKSNLFTELKKNGYEIICINDFKNPIKEMNIIFKEDIKNKIFFLHYTHQEEICFKYGIKSKEMTKYLKKIDNSIKNIVEHFNAVNLLIMGDHGMTQVEKNINLWGELNKLNSKMNKDYIVFLNSPMARFWFFNKKSKREILKLLTSLKKYGKIISKRDMRKFKIPINRKYGEIIFYVKDGINISPDFYHFEKIKGMHGYLNEKGPPLILYSTNKNMRMKRRCKLVDIMPTFLKLLNIKKSVKTDGKSVLL